MFFLTASLNDYGSNQIDQRGFYHDFVVKLIGNPKEMPRYLFHLSVTKLFVLSPISFKTDIIDKYSPVDPTKIHCEKINYDMFRGQKSQFKITLDGLDELHLGGRFHQGWSTALIDWFATIGESKGFKFSNLNRNREEKVCLGKVAAGELVFRKFVTVDGTLEVIDSKLATQSMVCGIGRSKAFGCGMLILPRNKPMHQTRNRTR